MAVLLPLPAGAESFSEEWEEAVPPSLRQDLPTDLEDAEMLGELLKTEALWEAVQTAFTGAFTQLRPFFLTVLLVALLYHIASLLFPNGEAGSVRLALLLGATLLLFRGMSGTWDRAISAIGDVSAFATGTVPIWGGILAAGGSEATALSAASGLGVFCTVTAHLASGVLSPLLRLLSLLVLFSFANVPMLSELSRTVRGWVLSLFGIFGAMLPAALAFQTALSSAADSMAVRTVKYAVGQSVPVVGGAISGALGTLASSLGLVKSTLGGASFLALCLLLLPPLAELFLCRMMLSVGSTVASCAADATLCRLFSEFKGLCDLLLAAVAAVFFVFLLLIAVLSRAGLAVGGGT